MTSSRSSACTLPSSALRTPRDLRATIDAWWDRARLDHTAHPPRAVRLVRRAASLLGARRLRLALGPVAHLVLRRAARRAAGVCLVYDEELSEEADEGEIRVELLETGP